MKLRRLTSVVLRLDGSPHEPSSEVPDESGHELGRTLFDESNFQMEGSQMNQRRLSLVVL